jgi:hypothetical protein
MAKKDSKKKKDKKGSGTSDPVEAVRSAVERTLKATSEGRAGAEKRGRDFVDEVAHAAQRFREQLGDLKVLDDLRKEVDSLRARVAALEGAAKPAGTTTASRSRTASRSTAAKSSAAKSSAAKPASSRAKASGGTRSTGARSSGSTGSTGGRSTASRSTAARSSSSRASGTRSTGTRPRSTRSSGSSSSGSSS